MEPVKYPLHKGKGAHSLKSGLVKEPMLIGAHVFEKYHQWCVH